MVFHIYQVIIIAISGLMITQGISRFVKGKNGQTLYKLAIRILVWGGMMVATIFPNAVTLLAKALGIIDNINAVILTGFLLIFLMIFKLLSAIERLEQDITTLTRKEALKDLSTKNSEK